MFTIAVITIGQSPRPDITSDLRKLLPEGVCMTEYGALDGLTRQQAEEQFGYRGRGELLITRMGGSGVKCSKIVYRLCNHMVYSFDILKASQKKRKRWRWLGRKGLWK